MLDRILLILKAKNLSSSQFADQIGVQRSSVSHVISGRNKPSLDFISKILETFQEISYEWMLTGKGEMFKGELKVEKDLFSDIGSRTEEKLDIENKSEIESESSGIVEKPHTSMGIEGKEKVVAAQVEDIPMPSNKEDTLKKKQMDIKAQDSPHIERIVIFFSNNTFIEYQSAKEND